MKNIVKMVSTQNNVIDLNYVMKRVVKCVKTRLVPSMSFNALDMSVVLVRVVSISAREGFGMVSQDPSDSKSNRLHVQIFQFCFIHLKYIL